MTRATLSRRLIPMALGIGLVGLVSCGPPPPPGVVYIERAPPPERVEVIGPTPAPGYVWIAGYWRWDGSDYEWEPGRWVAAERGHHKWNRGRWSHGRRGWYWSEGHWR